MFSGIVETTSSVLHASSGEAVVHIKIEKPKTFDDLHIGDSIAVDGVCLTVEAFDQREMRFALGRETLKVTGWSETGVLERVVNLERSLRLQDRLHGHLVTGHVDTVGRVSRIERTGATLQMSVEFPAEFRPLIWTKGSVAINGVSLTVNEVPENRFSVGLIPETLKRTNLGALKVGDTVNLEFDNMARGLVNWARLQQESL